MKKTWQILLFIVAVLLAWRIVVVGMTEYYVYKVKNGELDMIDKALSWDDDHPTILIYKAELIYEQDRVKAEQMLQTAVRKNPSDSRALMHLAIINQNYGEIETADKMMNVALQINPVNPRMLMQAAKYWYKRDKIDKSINYLSMALTADGSLKSELLPVFMQIAENPASRASLEPLAIEPPLWWDSFFTEVARSATNIDSVRVLYGYRKLSESHPLTAKERHEYISRLRRDELLDEAYLQWVNSLDENERHALGYLYNGNFELEFSNSGFGWYTGNLKRSGIVLNTAKTYGIDGEAALHLSFNGKEFRFNHLYQPLRLSTGKYKLSGKVRRDKLKTSGGLQWVIKCTVGMKDQIAESEIYRVASEWVDFNVDFAVPDGCNGQELRLVSTGRRKVDHEIRGELWFDSMRIQLVRNKN